jgi:two-component system, LytTR family, sensor kinase
VIENRIRAGRVWLVAGASFTAAALLFTSQVWIDFAYAGRRLSWGLALIVALIDWELWALLSPIVVWLALRFRFSRDRWAAATAIHVPCGIVVGAVKLTLEAMLTRLVLGYGRTPFSFLKIDLTLLTYWLIVAVTHVSGHYREARERERRALQLESSLARAQVEALKMQLHPHFLFNTLNTISGLMREDVEAADRMLAKLAELLRRTFETADIQELPLARELELQTATATHLIRESMTDLEARLDPARFVRIHRSMIVNVDRIRELQPTFHGEFIVLLHSGRRLRCSRTYAEKLTTLWGS